MNLIGSQSLDSLARYTIELFGFSWLKKHFPDEGTDLLSCGSHI